MSTYDNLGRKSLPLYDLEPLAEGQSLLPRTISTDIITYRCITRVNTSTRVDLKTAGSFRSAVPPLDLGGLRIVAFIFS